MSEIGAARGAGARMRESRPWLVAVFAFEAVLLVVAIAVAMLARAGAPAWRPGRGRWRARPSPISPRPARAGASRLWSETADCESKAA